MSVEEWFALDESEPGELVDGFLVDEEMADFIHDAVVSWLIFKVYQWLEARGGIVAGSAVKFGIAADRGRQPDATVYFQGRRPPARGLVRVPPDIAIEVVSKSPRDAKRDRIEKAADYAAFGVAYYWIVDPQRRTLEVLELGADGRYGHALAASEGIVTDIPGCPELSLDLSALWRTIDEHTA
jgi:Uma2 family endonuclease